jgi:2-hydroxy-3-keto-5-methylthiopentenyl-1-phosphate phosphatase
MNPLIQDILKLAETNQKEFTILHQGMKDLIPQSLQRLAIEQRPTVTSNIVSSSLEIENKRVYKRKKPMGERGNK